MLAQGTARNPFHQFRTHGSRVAFAPAGTICVHNRRPAPAASSEPSRPLRTLPLPCSAQALAALSELLAAKAELRQLHLWNGMSGDDGAVNLCPLLESAVKLEDFKFGYSRVASRGGVAVAQALGKTSSLVRLDLTGNTMGPDTARNSLRQFSLQASPWAVFQRQFSCPVPVVTEW